MPKNHRGDPKKTVLRGWIQQKNKNKKWRLYVSSCAKQDPVSSSAFLESLAERLFRRDTKL